MEVEQHYHDWHVDAQSGNAIPARLAPILSELEERKGLELAATSRAVSLDASLAMIALAAHPSVTPAGAEALHTLSATLSGLAAVLEAHLTADAEGRVSLTGRVDIPKALAAAVATLTPPAASLGDLKAGLEGAVTLAYQDGQPKLAARLSLAAAWTDRLIRQNPANPGLRFLREVAAQVAASVVIESSPRGRVGLRFDNRMRFALAWAVRATKEVSA